MKNAIIFHGRNGNPNKFWYSYLKTELENKGYKVWLPQLPEPETHKLEIWLPFVLENGNYDSETVLIGHSSGAVLILSVLENIKVKIKKTVLVAGFCEDVTGEGKNILQNKYDWEKIKNNCKDFIFINSDKDPFGCDDKSGRKMFNNLGGTQIILHDQGHMGSNKFKQPYRKFPLLVSLIETELPI